jgi:hypothetical protein
MFFNLPVNSKINSTSKSLTKKIYKRITKLHYSYVNEINSLLDENLHINEDDNFVSYIYDVSKQSYYKVNQYEYSEDSEAFSIVVKDKYIFTDMLDPLSLSNKINLYTKRYYPLEVNLEYKKEAHSAIFIFDIKSKISFIVDSNNTLDFCNYIFKNKCISYYLHNIYRHYSRGLGYKYIKHNYTLGVNIKIKSDLQQSFFDGYCRAWSFYFIYLCVTSDSVNIINSIRHIQNTDIEQANEFIEKFQVYYYNRYVKFVV